MGDELYLQIVPVMIGRGIPLFSPVDMEAKFSLKEVRQYKQIAEMHFILKTRGSLTRGGLFL
ncbi:hypothetical protein ACEQPO_03990 [Bacillus sp. SL00103]